MSLSLEGLRLDMQRIFLPKTKHPCANLFPEQMTLISIKDMAHTIAGNVRGLGKQKFGPMWAEGYVQLSDGRMAFLQESQEKTGIDGALVMNISPDDNNSDINIRYDLSSDEVVSYEKRQRDLKKITKYEKNPDLSWGSENLKLCDVVGPIEETLQLVQIASNNIKFGKRVEKIYEKHTRI